MVGASAHLQGAAGLNRVIEKADARARTIVMAAVVTVVLIGVVMLALGVIHLVAGLFALISGQPYGIWYPLVLLGAVMTIVFGALLPTVRRRYQDAEMRRIQAAALRRT